MPKKTVKKEVKKEPEVKKEEKKEKEKKEVSFFDLLQFMVSEEVDKKRKSAGELRAFRLLAKECKGLVDTETIKGLYRYAPPVNIAPKRPDLKKMNTTTTVKLEKKEGK